jgi:hypothetical protein
MSKPEITIPPERLELYNQLIESNPEIQRKGKTTPYTSLNGHMFSFLSKDGTMGLRLSEADRKEFLQEFNTRIMEQYGRMMKEYVVVPDDLLVDTKTLSNYLLKSLSYISTLKPKPTKKKSK